MYTLVAWLVIWLLRSGITLIPVVVRFFFRTFCFLLAGLFTPRRHRRYGDFEDSKGYVKLTGDGYDVTPWFAVDAVSSIKGDGV